MKYRRTGIVLLAITILCTLTTSTFASNIEVQNLDDFGGSFDVAWAFDYALAPDHIYPFIFDGSDPYVFTPIDVSNCDIGKMYVYNKDDNTLTLIGDDICTIYDGTADHLFYVTDEQHVIKTDYEGNTPEDIYTAVRGEISKFVSFGYYLSFIEGDDCLVILDTRSGAAEAVLVNDTITSAYMFDQDKIIWYSADHEIFYLNATTGTSTQLANEYEANCLVNSYIYVQEESIRGTYAVNNTGSSSSTNYNDVTFPLEEYDALLEIGGFAPDTVLSRFLDDEGNQEQYAGSDECDGFAKYAHDRFWHLYSEGRTSPSWQSGSSCNADYTGPTPTEIANESFSLATHASVTSISSKKKAQDFFENLDRGSFVRYTSYTDLSPHNGNHSIVFDGLSTDVDGIIAYECNMDWNCGVGYQQYTYGQIYGNYEYVLYYVEHDIPSTGTYENKTYHTVECSNCDGFLRQNHTDKTATYINSEVHRATYNCCNVSGATQVHTDVRYMTLNMSKHNIIYTCCNTTVAAAHTGTKSYSSYSSTQHRVHFSCCNGYAVQTHTFSNGRCSACGYLESNNMTSIGDSNS